MKKILLRNRIKPFLNEEIDSQSVLDAIKKRYKVKIKYDDGIENNGGNSKGTRVIMPMAIGTTKKGYPVLRAWQEGGGSRRGIPKWKFFILTKITSWQPLKNKKFFQAPNGYNPNGDKTMGTFIDNAKFDDFISPFEREKMRYQNDVKIGQQKNNQQGPIQQPRVTQQWKKNVFTSQPNSKRYAQIAKNVNNSPQKGDDFWKLFDLNDAEKALQQADMQNQAPKPEQPQSGPVDNSYDENFYDVNDVDFDENNFIKNKNRR